MKITHKVRCPNCGNYADRDYFTKHQIVQTACNHCDYLMVNSSLTGQVVEAYAPGLNLSCL